MQLTSIFVFPTALCCIVSVGFGLFLAVSCVFAFWGRRPVYLSAIACDSASYDLLIIRCRGR